MGCPTRGVGSTRCIPLLIGVLVCACFGEESSSGSGSSDSLSSTGTAPTSDATTSDATTTTAETSASTTGEVTGTVDTSTDPDSSGSSSEGTDTDAACRHRVFLSEMELIGGEIGSFENASIVCTAEARAEGLGGTWAAVLSDDMPAAFNITICGDVYLANDGEGAIDDSLVATAANWWTETHAHAIDHHASGAPLDPMTSSSAAWTGSNVDGTSNPNDCDGWGSVDLMFLGQWGWAAPLGMGSWISDGGLACNQLLHIYCIDQPE